MKKRFPNCRLVKIHRNYTVEDVVDLFGVHPNTVRNWISFGLQIIDTGRPTLILGTDLAAFLKDYRNRNKKPTPVGQMFCLKCKDHRNPASGLVDYEPFTKKVGNAVAICPVCNTVMNRRVSATALDQLSQYWDIRFPLSFKQLNESPSPILTCDLTKGV